MSTNHYIKITVDIIRTKKHIIFLLSIFFNFDILFFYKIASF